MKYFKASAVTALGLCLGLAGPAMAQQNARTDEAMFSQPPMGATTQIVLGAGDLILSYLLFPQIFPEAGDLKTAEAAVIAAMDLPVSEPMRQASINAIMSGSTESADSPKITMTAQERVRNLEKANIVSESEKQLAIARASEDLAIARARAVTAATRRGVIPKAIHAVRVLGSTLFLADAAGRVYVWYAMNANPTLSPVAQFVRVNRDRLGEERSH